MTKPSLDISAQRKKLDDAFSAGELSAREYRRIQKGMSNIAIGQKQGVEYSIDSESRSFDAKKDGQDVRGRLGGVTNFNPVLGRKTSKAITYIASNQPKEEQAQTTGSSQGIRAGSNISPQTNVGALRNFTLPVSNFALSNTNFINEPASSQTLEKPSGKSSGKTGRTTSSETEKKEDPIIIKDNPGTVYLKNNPFLQGNPFFVQKDDPKILAVNGFNLVENFLENNKPKSTIETSNKKENNLNGENSKNKGYQLIKPNKFLNFVLSPIMKYEKWRNEQITKSPAVSSGKINNNPGFKQGGSIPKFVNGTNSILEGINAGYKTASNINNAAWALGPGRLGLSKDNVFGSQKPSVNIDAPINRPVFDNSKQLLANATKNVGISKQMPISEAGKKPGLFNFLNKSGNNLFTQKTDGTFGKGLFKDKSSVLNTALGAFGVVSGLTNKAPTVPKSELANFRNRPISGDYDTLQRLKNSSTQTYLQSQNQLRNNLGSDGNAYMRGVLGSGINLDAMNNQAYMQDSQIRIQDRQRHDYVNLAEDQMNNQLRNQDIQNKFNFDVQRWGQRAQGAQAMLNSALQYGVDKRANMYNNTIAEKYANQSMDYMMKAQRIGLINNYIRNNQGKSPTKEQIDEMMKASLG